MTFAEIVRTLARRAGVPDAQAAIRAVHGAGATRWVAEQAGIAARTARRWMSVTPPAARRQAVVDLALRWLPNHVAAGVLRGAGGTVEVGTVRVAYDGADQGLRTVGEVDVDLVPVADALESGDVEHAEQALSDTVMEGYEPGLSDTLQVTDYVDGLTVTTPADEPAPPAGRSTAAARGAAARSAQRAAVVETDLLAAYRRLRRSPHAEVLLTDLRAAVAATREEVDAVLARLDGDDVTVEENALVFERGYLARHPAPVTETGVPGRVVEAARRLRPVEGEWISLTELRDALPDVPRAELDAALRRLESTGRSTLAPEANQRALTAADRAAALTVGGEANHLFALNPV
ncbi:hypothetical protein [Umezawaea beigongshangensis]|uniref:hypothetical protein n=1 Tax=Umezawaea beigongshangensis TaxID=2780383 RepID=UPI0018F1E839|nr:hypothetical protein [Umezawaea beigongshangensis]